MYEYNTSEGLNELLLKLLLKTKQLEKGKVYDFDFDHEFVPTEKYDKENTVFLLLTVMAKNFDTYLIHKISEAMDDIEPVSRLKKLVFRFISVPAKWIKTGEHGY